MKFPEFISGPTFSDGDIVSYSFGDAELNFRVLNLPFEDNQINCVASNQDFQNWQVPEDDEGFHEFDLAVQNWNYLEDHNHFSVAGIMFEASILKHTKSEVESGFSLDADRFQEFAMDDAKEANPNDISDPRPYWPTHENNFLLKTITHPHFNGFQYKLFLVEPAEYPACIAFFSLGRYYSLRFSLSLHSLHYNDKDIINPYSEATLHKMKEDLFEDLLSTVHVDYSAELLSLIKT